MSHWFRVSKCADGSTYPVFFEVSKIVSVAPSDDNKYVYVLYDGQNGEVQYLNKRMLFVDEGYDLDFVKKEFGDEFIVTENGCYMDLAVFFWFAISIHCNSDAYKKKEIVKTTADDPEASEFEHTDNFEKDTHTWKWFKKVTKYVE